MLYISKSKLPGAGKGLFTDTPIKKGTRIVEYTGDIITYKEYDERVQKNRYGYLFYINKNRCIDAYSHKEALARYANDAKGIGQKKGLSNNSKYEVIGNRCYIVAYRNIPAGGEILVGYGADYWRDIRYNRNLEKRRKKKKRNPVSRKKT
jgi:hypothetical protein